MRNYLISVILAVIIFNLLLKWQPWVNRLLLPPLILTAPFLGCVLSEAVGKKISYGLCILLFLFSLPWLFLNESRPLLAKENIVTKKRIDQYFANNPGFQFSYQRAVQDLNAKECGHIGLSFGSDSWEYPLWAMMNLNKKKAFRIEHVNVDNDSAKLATRSPFKDFFPCAVVSDNPSGKTKMEVNGTPFVRTRSLAHLNLYYRDEHGDLSKRSVKFHFSRVLSFEQTANNFIRDFDLSNPEDLARYIILRKEQLQAAREIQISDLDELYPRFGSTFERFLITGLESVIAGLTLMDQEQFKHGQILLREWNKWLVEHQGKLKEVLE